MNTKEEANTDKDLQVEIDEEVMMHMFHAYAAYHPLFQRAATKLLEEQPTLEPHRQQQPASQPTITSTAVETEDPPSL